MSVIIKSYWLKSVNTFIKKRSIKIPNKAEKSQHLCQYFLLNTEKSQHFCLAENAIYPWYSIG